MSENIQKSPLPCGGGLGVGETQSIKQGYKQTSLGILPQEWEVVRLGEVCFVQSGGTPSKNEKNYWENGTIKWLGSSVCRNLHYVDEITDFITERGLQNSSAKIFKQGTTLIALVGATIGKVAFLNFEAATNQNIAGIYPQDEKTLNQTFLFYISLMLHKEFIRLSSDKFKMANLSFVKSLQIPLPPLAEQEKIAQILGVWDKGISVLKSLIEAKTKRKKALMQRLLTPPTHPLTPSAREGEQKSHHDTKAPPLAGGVGVGYSHIENNRNDDKVLDCHDLTASNLAMTEKDNKAKQSLRFAEFTDKWQEMRLGDILEYEQPTKYLVKNTEYSNLYQTPVLTAGKTFILGKTNENFGVYKDLPIILFDDFMTTSKFVDFPFKVKSSASKILKPKTNNINLKIVFEMMQTIDFCAKDHKRYWISEYQNLTIKLPTLAEQKKIAQVLSACDKEIELLKSKFQCLKTQKKGLMQRLLNGEVRVKC